ncbi:nickel pincer cofactor biosynthesis protein LarC [bacterium]|nr:nickel pincer cofactor biosynthesis protein LarC [bacterium]MCI0604702.1 nickel pincer cofactor biosynthesis protein LarC [bacterium]
MAEKILYIEATSGVSGDMLLGALLDAGVPVEVLSEAWTALDIDNYEVEVFQTQKSGMNALRCRVSTQETKGAKTWKQYQLLLENSKLPEKIRQQTLSLVKRLFEIEASIHGSSLQKLHLHEMGGTDLLLDVTGTLSALDYLQPSLIKSSPVNTGCGFLTFSHGRFPIPAPATTKLLEGISVFQNEVEGELTTPTGALLIGSIAKSFGVMPEMKLENTGVGAGEMEIAGHPNVLRIFVGTGAAPEEEIYMVETNLDDSSPQVLAYFMEKAFELGALDVFFTPIFMKKNRPAVRLTLLVSSGLLESMLKLLFSETTAIGLRYWKVDRKTLDRRWSKIQLGKQEIRIKESYLNGTLANYQPEYEDCKKAAERLNTPVKEVIAQAIHKYLSK